MTAVEVYETLRFRGHGDDGPATEWRFRVKAFNGEIVAQSEGYSSKAAAEKGVRALRRALIPGDRFPEKLKDWLENEREAMRQENVKNADHLAVLAFLDSRLAEIGKRGNPLP